MQFSRHTAFPIHGAFSPNSNSFQGVECQMGIQYACASHQSGQRSQYAWRICTMPLYLDVHHHVEGLTAEGAAEAHAKDLACQEKHKVRYLKYWFDEKTGKV